MTLIVNDRWRLCSGGSYVHCLSSFCWQTVCSIYAHIYGSFALLLLVFTRFSAILYIGTNDIVGKTILTVMLLLKLKSTCTVLFQDDCWLQASSKLQKQLEKLASETSGPMSSHEEFPKTAPKTAAKAKAKPDKSQPVVPSAPSGDTSEAARNARLRRVCERKPSGKLLVPEDIHLKWKNNCGRDRDDLLEALESCEWDKDW